jgi:hypothetical protein
MGKFGFQPPRDPMLQCKAVCTLYNAGYFSRRGVNLGVFLFAEARNLSSISGGA